MIILFVFRNINNTWWNIFTRGSKYKHVDIITYDGDVTVAFLFKRHGIETKFLKKSLSKLMNSLFKCKSVESLIAVDVNNRQPSSHHLYIHSCNELARKLSGVDIPFTWNPYCLAKKLLKFDGKTNYKILSSRMKTKWT